MKTILVAGGAGFIGSHLVRKLLQEENSVICVDNFITGSKANIQEFQDNPNFTFVEQDITKPLLTISTVNQIYHLASPASPNEKSPKSYIAFPLETMMVNSVGTHNLLDLAVKNNARFLFASTSEVYGDPAVSPQPETYFGNVNPVGKRSVYDESKRFGEALTMAYVRKFDTDARIVRIFNTYGPGMQLDDGRVIPNFIMQALEGRELTVYGDGTQTRSFCYVDDMVGGLIRAMNTDIKGEVVNIGNPDEYTVLVMAEKIIKLVGSGSKIIYEDLPQDDPKMRKPDITRAQLLFSFSPKVSLEEGLQKTVQYFKEQSEYAKRSNY